MKHTSPRHRGFTLLETLIVLAILAAIAALVLPGAVEELRAARTDHALQDITFAADACRSEAIRTGQPWRLVLIARGGVQRLAMEPLTNADPSTRSATGAEGSAQSDPSAQGGPTQTRRQELLELAPSLTLGPSQPATTDDRPETDRQPAGAAEPDPGLLAIFLPDGSVRSPGFEASSRALRFRFTVAPGSGRLAYKPIENPLAAEDRSPSPDVIAEPETPSSTQGASR